MWGTTGRQRLRLAPLYAAIVLADRGPRRAAAADSRSRGPWRPGISIVIPDRDAPDLLAAALASAFAAQPLLDEPVQVIVATNGAPADRYADVARRFPDVTWVHLRRAHGFSAAIAAGLASARHDWTLLQNNDVELDAAALYALASERYEDVFAIAAQIHQRSGDGRREETGFTDWYVDAAGIHTFHAPVDGVHAAAAHLAASGGASLFRTVVLRDYVRDGCAYDPFYWEDVEWSVRAWRSGMRVVFCPAAQVTHAHRATTARFYAPAEIERVVERNRVLFDARNASTNHDAAWLMRRICDLDYRSQRELSPLRTAIGVLQRRREARRRSLPHSPPALASSSGTAVDVTSSFSFRLRPRGARPCILVVTPFCVFPARHGGARRVEGLLRFIREDHDVVLLSDEASLYDSRSFAHFDGLHGVTVVQRDDGDADDAGDLGSRMRTHAHAALGAALAAALRRYRPAIVQIEYAELASLPVARSQGERWVLALHDVYRRADFRDPGEYARLDDHVKRTFDAVTVCSADDQRLIDHPSTFCVPNGAADPRAAYRRSAGACLLFMGPFRYSPNLEGIRRFLAVAWPAIRAAVPAARLAVLGGDGAPAVAASDALFGQSGVDVHGHRDDVAEWLRRAAVTINPLAGIRGSSVKLIESLMAGRVCVTTMDGARGFSDVASAALEIVPDVESMAQPLIALLRDDVLRHRREAPDATKLARYTWAHSAKIQREVYRTLLGGHG